MTGAQHNLLARMIASDHYIGWHRYGHNGGTWRLFNRDGTLIYYGTVQPATKSILLKNGWIARIGDDRWFITDAGRAALRANQDRLKGGY